jgi:hypothetical protein
MKNAITLLSWAMLQQQSYDLDDQEFITRAFENLLQTEHGKIIISWLVIKFNVVAPSFSPDNTNEMNAFLDGQKSVISEIIQRLLMADKERFIANLTQLNEKEEQDVGSIQQ